jgi:hypothetical protein
MKIFRSLPKNISTNDLCLFNHEIEVIFDEPILYFQNKVFLDSELGVISFTRNIVFNYFKFICKKIFSLDFKYFNKIYFKDSINITDEWTYGYFHWMLDCLPKLIFISNQNVKGKILLPAHLLKFDYVSQSLMKLGFNNFHFIDSMSICYTRRICQIEKYPKTGNYFPFLTDSLRSLFSFNQIKSSSKNIFVSRRKVGKRYLLNEDDVIPILNKYNFEIVFAEDLDFNSQAQLFLGTKNLISIHGAGLSNMIFLHSGCNILELRRKDDNINNCYFSLSSALCLNYYYILCDYILPLDRDIHNSNYIIDKGQFEKTIKLMLNV